VSGASIGHILYLIFAAVKQSILPELFSKGVKFCRQSGENHTEGKFVFPCDILLKGAIEHGCIENGVQQDRKTVQWNSKIIYQHP
jgi:hypothetical protein